MRPRSAGSSRISKLILPFLTLAAISSASPLSGTRPLVVATVAVRLFAEARADVELSCGWRAPIACAVGSVESASTWAGTVLAERSWAGAAGVVAAAPSTARPAVSGLAVVAGWGGAPFWPVVAIAPVAEVPVAVASAGSDDVGFAAALVDAAEAACVFPGEVFGVTGTAAATVVV